MLRTVGAAALVLSLITACGGRDHPVAGSTAVESPATTAAAATYARYVETQAADLIAATEKFVAAVKAGDVAEAKRLYPIARTPWERIEPVAEVFGDLDPLTDGREADARAEGRDFTGWHRLEKQLWVDGTTDGMGPYAEDLLSNIRTIVRQAADQPLTAVQLAEGSKGLLDEVASSKITGEEDEFSHTDLWDFRANVDGSQAAIDALRPVLEVRDPALTRRVDRSFAALDRELNRHRVGDGWASYDTLTAAQIRKLADAVAAVSEPVSRVAAVVGRA